MFVWYINCKVLPSQNRLFDYLTNILHVIDKYWTQIWQICDTGRFRACGVLPMYSPLKLDCKYLTNYLLIFDKCVTLEGCGRVVCLQSTLPSNWTANIWQIFKKKCCQYLTNMWHWWDAGVWCVCKVLSSQIGRQIWWALGAREWRSIQVNIGRRIYPIKDNQFAKLIITIDQFAEDE